MSASNILVIDDDEKVRDLLRQTLERSGYPVLTAADGREALRLIDGQVIHLVIHRHAGTRLFRGFGALVSRATAQPHPPADPRSEVPRDQRLIDRRNGTMPD